MLVAGIDSSTQSCKVIVKDVESGKTVREGRAKHPDGTSCPPDAWWYALLEAIKDAGGLDDVEGISVGAQQHGMVLLDDDGEVVRDALLWNDTRSAPQVDALNDELGEKEWIERVGLPLGTSFTVTKLRWVADNEPEAVERAVTVCLPHDYLTWRLKGFGPGNADFSELTTDRSDASGTGYWSAADEDYHLDLLEMAFGKKVEVPRIVGPRDSAGVTADGIDGVPAGIPIGAGAGDNAAAALALGLDVGDAAMSFGTSGTVYARTAEAVKDPSGIVAGFADATGDFLPLLATLNSARDLDAIAKLLDVTHDELAEMVADVEPGAEGVTILPYFEGERTPYLPEARASIHGLSLKNFTRENLARAMVEGMVASQVAMIDAAKDVDVPIERLYVIGGAAKNPAVRSVLAQILDVPLLVPDDGEYVAIGAAKQAAAAVTGEFPDWDVATEEIQPDEVESVIMEQHEAAKKALGYVK